jgi:elongation factor G
VELVAESNDSLMEKYFEQGTLDEEDILPNINNAIAQSKLCPVFAVSSITQVGLRALLNGLVEFAPDPAHHEAEWGKPVDAAPDAERLGRKYNDTEPFSAYCFRTVADPFAGRINVFKIISGHLQTDANALNSSRGISERLGALHVMQGKTLDKVSEAHAGDIIACVKLKETQTGEGVSAVRFGTAARRNGGREVEEALRRGSDASSAEGSVQGDDYTARGSSGPAQEADRWARAVWRLQVRV